MKMRIYYVVETFYQSEYTDYIAGPFNYDDACNFLENSGRGDYKVVYKQVEVQE